MTHEQKNHQLYLKQKQMLDMFLEHGAISQSQHDKNENLRNGWCASFCWNKPEYDGNQELIRLGCIPIDDAWDIGR